MAVPNLGRAIGNEAATALSSPISNTDLSITVSDGSVFNSTGGYAIIDEGQASEEVVYIDSVSGSTLTVNSTGRGLSGTVAAAHDSGASITDIGVAEMFNGLVDSVDLEHDDNGAHSQLNSQIVASGDDVTTTNKVLDQSGWIASASTWSFTSYTAGTQTAVFGVTADETTLFSPGDRIRFTQPTDGEKQGIITVITPSTVTVLVNADFDVDNEAVTNVFISHYGNPPSWTYDRTKYTLRLVDANNFAQSSPTANTFYNFSGLELTIPTGIFDVSYATQMYVDNNATTGFITVKATLATANNAETDAELTTRAYMSTGTSNDKDLQVPVTKRKLIATASPTAYYLNIATEGVGNDTIGFRGSRGRTIIEAICAYL